MDQIFNDMFEESQKLFAESKCVNYWPYIGKGYFKSKTRILVLGESHYSDDPTLKKFGKYYNVRTNELIVLDYLGQGYTRCFESFMDFPKWIPYPKDSYFKGFRNTANMLVQNEYQNSDYVWENLAFYNFFQRPVAECPGKHDWLYKDFENYINQARQAFNEVMLKLVPDIVIVWGNDKLPKKWMEKDFEKRYSSTKFFQINHPSYTIRKIYRDGWIDFISRNNIDDSFKNHHTQYDRIEKLFKMFLTKEWKNIIKSFEIRSLWYAERSIGIGFSPDMDGESKRLWRKTTALLLVIDEDSSAKLIIGLGEDSDNESPLKILKSRFFSYFADDIKSQKDDFYIIKNFSPNETENTFLETIKIAAKGLFEYRHSDKKL